MLDDILGTFSAFRPKFAKCYAEIGRDIERAIAAYAADVRTRRFPAAEKNLAAATGRFGEARVQKTPAVMGGEDFSRYWLADKSIQSLIFWVGGTPKAKWDAAGGDQAKLPSLHSPFWAPDAEAVISTATEAMTSLALDLLKKG